MNRELPEGFENVPKESVRNYRRAVNAGKPPAAPTVNFRGRPGGGMKNLGQTVEHAANARDTLRRLLKYFKSDGKLLVLLLAAVVFVTLAALLAPSLQGSAIDTIKERAWQELLRYVIMLLIVYLMNALFTLAQSVLAARLSQSITRRLRHDLFKKIANLSP